MTGRTMAEIWVAVRLDTSKTGAELNQSLSKVDGSKAGEKAGDSFGAGFGKSMKRIAGLAVATLGSRAVVSGVKGAVDAASDLNETTSKSQQIFGRNAAAIDTWSKKSVRAFGLSQNEALGAAASFGDMFQQLGFSGKAAAQMSTDIVGLSADLGSFNNLPTADVLDKISSSFRGEFDGLQQLVPNINAARVEHEALAATGKKTAKELTAQEKATATLAIIQKDSARAAGDFARTSGGLANQQKIAAAQAEQLKASFGKALLPVFISGATVLNDKLLPPLIDLAEKHGPKLAGAFDDLSVKAGPLVSGILDKAGTALHDLSTGSSDASPALASLADSGGKLAPVVTDLVAKVPSFTDVLNVGATAVGFLADHTDELSKAMPFLVAGIVAYKAAQLAANVAALLAVPTKVAEVIVNRQLVASNKALIASRAGAVLSTTSETVATGANTGAKNAGILATARQRLATIASSVATKAVAVTTALWTGAQWLLNAALTANPIGLVVVGIGLLVAALILAWKKSETFRTIVGGAFDGVKKVASVTFNWIKDNWKLLLGILTAPITLAKIAITALLDAKTGVQKVFSGAVAGVGRIWSGLEELSKKPIRFMVNTVLNDGLIGAFNWVSGKFGGPTIGKVPLPKGFAHGGRIPGRPSAVDNLVARGPGGEHIGLATGEYIVNARATAKFLPLLERINRGYADGGLFGKLKNGITGALGQARDFGSDALGFLKDPVGWFKDRFAGPLRRLDELGGSPYAQVVKAIPHKLASTIMDKAKDLVGFGGGPGGPPGAAQGFRGVTLNQRTIGMLLNAERILGAAYRIFQGSYSTRVAASGSTHAGGGAMDTDGPRGWGAAVTALRKAGFAAWHRTPAQGPWGHHIHAIAIGDSSASAAAKAQVQDFLRGGDGLGGLARGGSVANFLRGVRKFDQGGLWESGTLGVNLSGKTETVVPGSGQLALDDQTLRRLAKMLAQEMSQVRIDLDGNRVDTALSRVAFRRG